MADKFIDWMCLDTILGSGKNKTNQCGKGFMRSWLLKQFYFYDKASNKEF